MTLCPSLAATLDALTHGHPEAPALIAPGKDARSWHTVTFGELNAQVHRFAHGLSERGVASGDRVLVLIRPSADLYALLFALFRLGAIPVLMDPGMGLSRMLTCIAQAKPRVMVALPIIHALAMANPAAFSSVQLRVTAGRRWLWGGPTLEQCRPDITSEFPDAQAQEDACSLIVFTSGSTGSPKGVQFSRRMMRTQLELLQAGYGWKHGDTMLMCFAAFALFSIACGMTTVLPAMDMSKPARARPADIADALVTHRATHAFASPVIWENLVRDPDASAMSFPSLQQVITTGAPIQVALHQRLAAIFPAEAQLHTPYGATEALPVTTIASAEVLAASASAFAVGQGICVGRPFTGVQVSVIRISDGPIAAWDDTLHVPTGSIGEIVVQGDVVSIGYDANPEANRMSRIRKGDAELYRMGDLGRLDDQGRLWFCGRKAHRIEKASGMLAPVPVETVFNQHPAVRRTALVGVGPRGSQQAVLCVEMEKGARFSPSLIQELKHLARGTVFDGEVSHILHHPGFPVDARHNAKILREELAAWATRRLARHPEKGTVS